MDHSVHNKLVSFIWNIADDCLRDVYVRGKYRDVILPMVVLRRLDTLLEPSKQAVLDEVKFQKEDMNAAELDDEPLKAASSIYQRPTKQLSKDATMTNPIEIYQTDNLQIEIKLDLSLETLWLTQRQMAEVLDKDVRTINEHLKNIFKEQELTTDSTVRKFRIVQQEGTRQVNREVEHYNLDAILSVGYRVNSKKGTQFRQWATRTLRQHLLEGYTLNQQRLAQRGIEMEQALSLLSSTLKNQQMVSESGEAVLVVISDYARSWSLLQAYDEQSLTDSQQKQAAMQALELNSVLQAIAEIQAPY